MSATGPVVAVDCRALVAGGGGLRRYTGELMRGLAALGVNLLAWLAGWHIEPMRAQLADTLAGLGLDVPVDAVRVPGKLLYEEPGLSLWRCWPRWLPPPQWLPREADIYHAISWPVPLDRRVPTVLTIHDLFALRQPTWVPPNVLSVHRAIAALAPRAAQIIVDSDATGAEVLALTRVPPERITTVPLAVDHERFGREVSPEQVAAAQERHGLDRPYFMTIGTIEPRRNTARLVEAYDLWCERNGPELDLLVVGRRIGSYPEADEALARPRRGTVHVRTDLPDEDLVALMRGALGFVFVSLVEGFGLPVLEAFVAGAPVITAATTSLPEVAGDAALLVDPADVGAIAEAMGRLAEDPALADDLRRRGRERARQFTWERTARLTLDVYHRAMV